MIDDASNLDDLIRRVDPDRWVSSRFIGNPRARTDVVSIYAFDHELARAPRVASNSLLGEIRLTWWREVLEEIFEDRPIRLHPTAQALAATVRRMNLPRDLLEDMIDARYRELDPTPMSEAERADWARDTAGAAAVLAAAVLGAGENAAFAMVPGAAWTIGRLPATAGDLTGLLTRLITGAREDARRLSAGAFPAVAHAALTTRPAQTELGKRLRITWAVARGRI